MKKYKKKNLIIPIILCGGTGTRLWPFSRESFPKQFLSVQPNNKESLFQETCKRLLGIKNINSPIFICNEEHRFIVAEQSREIGVVPESIILEPFRRNTAPAIALAALKSQEIADDPLLIILSSDHLIKDPIEFRKVVQKAKEVASKDKLITFGIVPERADTGYGYIETESPLDIDTKTGSKIIRFIEKPNKKLAEEYSKNKKYTWNSGMFLFKTSKILSELKKYSPDLIDCCKNALNESILDLDFQRINKSIFESCPDISIDISVMEKTDAGVVFPLNAGWSDVGNWKSVWEISNKDDRGNVLQGDVLAKDTKNCFLKSENSLIATLGIENLVVIETGDAILISDIDKAQDIKKLVLQMKEKSLLQGIRHKKIFRPWGNYTSIVEGIRWQVKLINVNPGAVLSLQMHHHRSEHWIVVRGTAQVEIDGKISLLNENESTYIPVCSKHRLKNPGKLTLSLIEVQSGPYLGEDDIVRFADAYGRIES